MMYATATPGSMAGFGFLFALHAGAMVLAVVGVLLLLFWAFRYLPEAALWKWGWIFTVVGAFLCILTLASGAGFGMMNGRGMGFYGRGYEMMGGGMSVRDQASVSPDQLKEEAEGKALYDAFAAGTTTCASLTDDQFELIGEYIMGGRLGASHEAMNVRIKQMMGDEGEVQMHINLGRSAIGCFEAPTYTTDQQGMMQGGSMMFRAASSAPTK